MKNGCFYYCDGGWRQSLNVAFNKDVAAAGDGQACNHMDRCEFDGIKLRPGDKVEGYKAERSANCANERKEITCKMNPDSDFTTYKYSYCMPWDGTTEVIINDFHP